MGQKIDPMELPNPVRYTTAPIDYDYGYTVTTETFQLDGKHWRRVAIKHPGRGGRGFSTYHIEYQCGRYQSGWYPVLRKDPRYNPAWLN